MTMTHSGDIDSAMILLLSFFAVCIMLGVCAYCIVKNEEPTQDMTPSTPPTTSSGSSYVIDDAPSANV